MIKVMIIIKGGPGLGPGPPLIMIMTLIMSLIMIMTLIMTLIMINNTPVLAQQAKPPVVCFHEKRCLTKKIMRIYKKKVHLCVFLRKLIKYGHPFPPSPHPTPQASSILNQASQPSRPGPGPTCARGIDSNSIGNIIGNTIGNSIGNTIGNSIGNTIGNTIGNI